jgi:hypothetical protein
MSPDPRDDAWAVFVLSHLGQAARLFENIIIPVAQSSSRITIAVRTEAHQWGRPHFLLSASRLTCAIPMHSGLRVAARSSVSL